MDAKTSAYIDSIVDRKIVLAFDLYGTLLSTESISKKLAEYYGDKADALAATWRRYQLEYTWRLNSMGSYLLICYNSFTIYIHCTIELD